MRYGIIVNPYAGTASVATKRRTLERVQKVFGPDTLVEGWDCTSVEELSEAARDLAGRVDVLVVAGGDGTFSDVMNAVDASTVLSFVPMGSGNAWRKILKLGGYPKEVAVSIKNGTRRRLDVILCDGGRKGMFASIGIEGHVLDLRRGYLDKGTSGFSAYVKPTIRSLFGGYERYDARVEIDGKERDVSGVTTLVVTKTPYYGYAFRAVPKARADDGLLHVLTLRTGLFGTIAAIATSFLGGNLMGEHSEGKVVKVVASRDVFLQIDGNLDRKARDFAFQVLPGALLVQA